MVLLHIGFINKKFTGVNMAVKSMICSQSKLIDVALLNVADKKASFTPNEFLYIHNRSIEALSPPFNKPCLVIFHEIYRLPYLNLYSELLKKKIPYIIIPHGGLTNGAQSIKRLKKEFANLLLFNRFIKKAEAIQYLSSREFNESIFKNKYIIASNGVQGIIPKKSFKKKITSFVYIGRLDIYIKGIDLLLKAIEKVKENLILKECTIDLYGPNENACHGAINKIIVNLGIDKIVSLHDAVSGEEKENILLKADCFIQTSRSEGMSMGILEALSYGLPCLLSTGTSMNDLINKYDAGWICETNVCSIAQTIINAIEAYGSIELKSAGAIKLIEDNFLIDKVTNDTLMKYKKIISEYGVR